MTLTTARAIRRRKWGSRRPIEPYRDRRPRTEEPAYSTPGGTTARMNASSEDLDNVDCLGRARFTRVRAATASLVVATIASAGYEQQIDDLLTTLELFAPLADVLPVVLVAETELGSGRGLYEVAARHGALAVPCFASCQIDASIKALLYSIARIVPASKYLCLDSDVFVLDDLKELRAAIDDNPNRILAAMSSSTTDDDQPRSLRYVATRYYSASADQAAALERYNSKYFLRLNSGVYAGDRAALLSLDAQLRKMQPGALPFINSGTSRVADELVFSLAVGKIGGVVELDKWHNLQMYAEDAAPVATRSGYQAWHGDQRVKFLHFAAQEGRAKLAKWREVFNLP